MYIKMKKSQMKMAETVSILIVFFILIFASFVIYANQKSEKIDKEIDEKNLMTSIEIATRAYMLPEIQCSESQCIGCTGAMDMLKLNAVSNYSGATSKLIFNNPLYFQEFGYATIKVEIVYPEWDNLPHIAKSHNWTIYNRTLPNANRVLPSYMSINIFNPFDNQCYFGVMEVATYT